MPDQHPTEPDQPLLWNLSLVDLAMAAEEADEWEEMFRRTTRERFGGGFRTEERVFWPKRTPEIPAYTLTGPELGDGRLSLLLVPEAELPEHLGGSDRRTDVVVPFLIAVGEPPPEIVENVVSALREASERVGKEHETIAWVGAIACDPDGYLPFGEYLAEPGEVAGMRLTSAERPMEEFQSQAFGGPYNPYGVMLRSHLSLPALVEGASTSFDYARSGIFVATREIYRLCALLSLAWQAPWVLREGPQPVDRGELAVVRHAIPEFLAGRLGPLGLAVRVPVWVEEASERLLRTPGAEASLAAHYQGLRLYREHPSLAVVAFTGSFEQAYPILASKIGGRYIASTERGARVEAVVRAVAETEESADALLGDLYPKRSAAGHGDVVLGHEATFGLLEFPGPFSDVSSLGFAMGTARLARHASRAAIHRVLGITHDPNAIVGLLPSTEPDTRPV